MTATATSPSPYFTALDTLEEFLHYADTVGSDVVLTIALASDNPDEYSNDAFAEVTLLQKVDEGWLLYIKVVGRKKGSYALRVDVSSIVVPLSLKKLQSRHFKAIPRIAKVAEDIMHNSHPLNT